MEIAGRQKTGKDPRDRSLSSDNEKKKVVQKLSRTVHKVKIDANASDVSSDREIAAKDLFDFWVH